MTSRVATLSRPKGASHESLAFPPTTTIASVWILGALVASAVAAWKLDAAPPLFTVIWLVVPLITLLRHGTPRRIGIRAVALAQVARASAVAILAVACVTLAVEPWSRAYSALVAEALAADPADITFGWLARFDGVGAWASFIIFSTLVTIFAEELFFRGWLLQLLCCHMKAALAIVVQAALFTLPQALVALFLAPSQAVVYIAVYSFAAIGVIGGYAAWRTASIWPSLVLATAFNAVLTLFATTI
jgi:membrane protease YdiL (CAAX protease family)